jgi:hypothetical protein
MPKLTRKQRKELVKKSRRPLLVSGFVAIILLSATYAWFIGSLKVNMAGFVVNIAASDSLLVSLDGENWTTEIVLSDDVIQDVSYEQHTNKWSKLVPISTVGEIDSRISRLVLYEHSSFTPTYGGYRIMTERVDNTGLKEADGYVVFDLFIKNFSGRAYMIDLDYDSEEAIYLSTDSTVSVPSDGVANTGIENAIRLAFAQIGRVIATTIDTKTIVGITCYRDSDDIPEYNDETGVTGVCRTDSIWEPNDTKHTSNAIRWYNASCRRRTGFNIDSKSSYSTIPNSCGKIEDGKSYPTYAVKGIISSFHNVDIYDGEEFNGYTHPEWRTDNVNPKNDTRLLYPYPYFTDTMKMQTGTNRPEVMRLAPNSVTKIRVYIYIEGQDVDNYDYAQIGKKVSVRLGFTKQRFTPGDIDPDNPIDITPPVITIAGSEYVDAGATAVDDVDGDVTDRIEIDSNVNPLESGTYRVIYSVVDSTGNKASKMRYVIVY